MLADVIDFVASALTLVIFVDALLSFIPSVDRRNPIVRFIRGITEPIYRPLRKVIPAVRLGDVMLDLSPLIVIFGIRIIAWVIKKILGV